MCAQSDNASAHHNVLARLPGVLVIEDDALIRSFIKHALEDAAYHVRVAANGFEALNHLHKWTPNVILMDLMMPEMDGPTFRSEQQRHTTAASVPVVLMSAIQNIDHLVVPLQLAAVLSKPFSIDRLLTTINAAVKRSFA